MTNENVSRRGVLRATAAGAAATLTVGQVGAQAAPRRIVGTSGASGVRAAKAKADAVRRVLDFDDIGQAVAGRFSDQAVAALERRADVRYVEEDITMHAISPGKNAPGNGGGGSTSTTAETLPWGIDRVDADVAHANGYTGAGADIAIIDTGIDDDHPDLAANLGTGRAFTRCKGRTCNYDWSDDNDHGTHCAGTAGAVDNSEGVIGVSTEATLHAVKVLDRRGSGSLSDVAAGIEYTADQGWDVGSLSLGASSGAQTLKDACTYAVNNGVTLVAAAGNDGACSDCVGFPAAYDECIAVSATDSADNLASFSSTGPEVEIAAPGVDVLSSVSDGTYDRFNGTSMATPHVAGAAGQLAAQGYSNDQIRSTLTGTAEDLGLAANEQGNGLLDVAAALSLDSSNN